MELTQALDHDHHQLVTTAAAFADSGEWLADGATSAGAWLAIAGVEACTAREWIRIGRLLDELPTIAATFAAGRLSYATVRTLTRIATPTNEADLAARPPSPTPPSPTSPPPHSSEPSSTTPRGDRSTPPAANATPPPDSGEWSGNATEPVSTAAATPCSNTTTTRPYQQTHHTVIDQLELRCAPCHHHRHRNTG